MTLRVHLRGRRLLISAICMNVVVASHASAQVCLYFESQKLIASDALENVTPGMGVSLDMDEFWSFAGAPGADEDGAVYVFRLTDADTPSDPTDDAWVEHVKLVPSQSEPGRAQGHSLSFDGSRMIVGDINDDTACPEIPSCYSGSAYIYRHDDAGTAGDLSDDLWVEEDKLVASDAGLDKRFGDSVAIFSDWAAVGSVEHDCWFEPSVGKVYIFRRDDGGTPSDPLDDTWIENQQLLTPFGQPNDRFGTAVGLSADTLVVGAPSRCRANPQGPDPGWAHVYRLDTNGTPEPADDTWVFLTTLVASTPGPAFNYGFRLDIEDDLIVIGSPEDTTLGVRSGSVYVYRRDPGVLPDDTSDDSWIEEAWLRGSQTNALDRFGWSMSVRADRIVVGALAADVETTSSAGEAYVFRLTGGVWREEQLLRASDPQFGDSLGSTVAVDGARVQVANFRDDNEGGEKAGAIYSYLVTDDCNQNCTPDEDDIANQTSQDCDGNGVPDECEDCNGNGVADACDLANCQPGQDWCQDCDANGILDACDPDCNANGAPDDCDVANCPPGDLTCQDCNANGIPDPCDIASGLSADCTADGIPDECAAVCVADCECLDMDVCTFDRCIDGTCMHFDTDYADVDHNGTISLNDLFCVLNAFSDDYSANCHPLDVDLHGDAPAMSASSPGVDHHRDGPIGGRGSSAPCFPNGTINLLDLFAVMDAFADLDPCCGG